MILEQIRQENEDEWREPREVGTYRASELGRCPRQIQYVQLGYKPTPHDPELLALFKDGNLHHEAVRAELHKVVRLTNKEQMFRKKYKYKDISFYIQGHTDGLINGDFVHDVKSMTTFKAPKLERVKDDWRRVKEIMDESPSSRSYYPQMQVYMDLFDKEFGVILFKNKDSGHIFEVWFPRDRVYFNETLIPYLAALHVKTKKKELHERPYKEKSKDCQQCPMFVHCRKGNTNNEE